MQLFSTGNDSFRRTLQVPAEMLAYQAVLAAAACLAVVLSLHHDGSIPYGPVIGLGVIAAFAERGRVSLSSTIESSISLLPTVFAAVLFGPAAAALVGAASFLGEIRAPYPLPMLRWGVYTSSRAITGAVAGVVALWVSTGSGVGDIVTATACVGLVAEAGDIVFACITMKVRRGAALATIKTTIPVAAASLLLYVPIVALLGLAYKVLSPWTLVFFFVPALAAQRLFGLYQIQRRLTDDLTAANAQLEAANLSFATALVATLDARDRYTAGHSAAVAIYARDIAIRMGLSREEQELAHLCGLVHDIGKIGLPAGLLEKPGALTLEERKQMERHSEIGERILSNVASYRRIASIVRHHHERVDGQGYPDGQNKGEIPLLARIIAVADAYNAMTSDRPYREAMPSRVARIRLAQAVESQFDTAVVAAFEALLAGAAEEYRSGARSDFRFGTQAEAHERSPGSLQLVVSN